jgi:hypothetical protein
MHEGADLCFRLVMCSTYLCEQRRELLPSHQHDRRTAKQVSERQKLTQDFDERGRKMAGRRGSLPREAVMAVLDPYLGCQEYYFPTSN